jgi:uncharacterized membrane protein
MFARVISTWEEIRDSLWALPLGIATACGLLAFVALGVDLPWISEISWIYSGGSQQAPEFASSLVGAMITLTALAFSITMVVLTLAAQQLGPRLIEIFMRDRSTQASLGLFLGTVIYMLLVLRALDGAEDSKSPALAITGGTALVLASMVTLLLFVHSLAQSIVSDAVVGRVGAALDRAICFTFPEKTPPENERSPPPRGLAVRLKARGYVQRIDYAGLVREACSRNAVIELTYDTGTHIVDGEVDAWVVAVEDLTECIGRGVMIGSQRSPGRDPEWSARQLVEIALRALSSGINDVFTALAVIDRLTLSLAQLATRGEAPRVWLDDKGAARVFGPAPTFELMLGAAFNQIREAGGSQGAVVRRLADSLRKLAAIGGERHARAIERQFVMLESTARRLEDDAESLPIEAAIREGRASLRPAPVSESSIREL